MGLFGYQMAKSSLNGKWYFNVKMVTGLSLPLSRLLSPHVPVPEMDGWMDDLF